MAMSSYNDHTPVNGKVSATKSGGPDIGVESASGGADAGGTDAMREGPQTKQAGYNSTPSRGNKVPSGVDHYSDAGV